MRSLLLRNGLVAGRRQDLALREGRIHRIGPDLEPARFDDVLDVADRLVLPGFVETHIHPDKAFIADLTHGLRAGGPSPQTLVAELKKAFTVDDIYARARRVLEAGRPSRLHDHARARRGRPVLAFACRGRSKVGASMVTCEAVR